MYRAITNFVTFKMGEQYVTPPVVNLENVLEQSTPQSPIVFILSPGADPAGDLGKLAELKGFGGNRFKFLAMGQGQEKVWHRPASITTNVYMLLVRVGCIATIGDSLTAWALVDATELSPFSSMAD